MKEFNLRRNHFIKHSQSKSGLSFLKIQKFAMNSNDNKNILLPDINIKYVSNAEDNSFNEYSNHESNPLYNSGIVSNSDLKSEKNEENSNYLHHNKS